jgi:hypothetical protein
MALPTSDFISEASARKAGSAHGATTAEVIFHVPM